MADFAFGQVEFGLIELGLCSMFAYGQTGSGKTFTVSGLERHVAETLMDGSLEGDRRIHISVIELAGQTAYGQ